MPLAGEMYGYLWRHWSNANMFTFSSSTQAEERSVALLKSWLTAEQLRDYEENKHFVVRGNDSGKLYQIVSALNYNILELDENKEFTGTKFCVVPRGNFALGDQLLAQKIWLETDETATLEIANKSNGSMSGYG